jgi:glycosyltransferase involved in cell wall biosynthesis
VIMATINQIQMFPVVSNRTGWPWDQPVSSLPPIMPNGRPWPRITVVTPAYKQADFLEETMRSVLLQGYPNLEYMVIDDESPDHTPEVIRKYEPWLAYTTRQPNGGQPNAVNNGFRRSTGEIMSWINSDDILLPRALERIATAFVTDPNVKVVCGFRKEIDRDSRVIRKQAIVNPRKRDLERCCFIAQETVYWRREVWEKAGPLDESFGYALDYEYWHRLLSLGYEFHLLPYYLGCIRLHPESKGATLAKVRDADLNRIYKRYLGREVTEFELHLERRSLHWRGLVALRLGQLGLYDIVPIAKLLIKCV